MYKERHYNPDVLTSNYKEMYLPVKVEEPATSMSRMGSIGVLFRLCREKY